MNPLMAATAVLMAGASIWSFMCSEPKMAVIYACYAVANAVLGTVRA